MATKQIPSSVDAYIANFPKERQARQQKLRLTIKSAMPSGYEETIRWGMPTYRVDGKNIIHFATFKNHIGLFTGNDAIKALQDDLNGFTTTKAVIHLPHDKPLPLPLVGKIVRWCAKSKQR